MLIFQGRPESDLFHWQIITSMCASPPMPLFAPCSLPLRLTPFFYPLSPQSSLLSPGIYAQSSLLITGYTPASGKLCMAPGVLLYLSSWIVKFVQKHPRLF